MSSSTFDSPPLLPIMSLQEIHEKLAGTHEMLAKLECAKVQAPDSPALRLSEKSLRRRLSVLEAALASAESAALDGNGELDHTPDISISTPVAH